jgi:hypothetical protein
MLVLCTTKLKFTLYKPNQLDQDSIEKWAYVNMIMNFQVPHKYGISLSAEKLSTFQRKSCNLQLSIGA